MAADPAADDRRFRLTLPDGWQMEPDEEDGGVLIAAPSGSGLLHVVSFPQTDEELADPAEELYAFLEEQGVELEEDDVEDVPLGGDAEMALCEYLAEVEDGDDQESATYWLVAVATAPGTLVFCSYSCPAGEEEREREQMRDVLASLRVPAGDSEHV